ncbi:class I SAM-dependent methyltransferase [Lentzea alba]|uniref:methyltransferase n=1 Tax=Lentzea alba TaxID=2714351 RepID=UPI0039BFDD0C
MRLITYLERSRVSEVSLPSSVVRNLMNEPSAMLADLSALQRIRYHGEPLPETWQHIELVRVADIDDVTALVEATAVDEEIDTEPVELLSRAALLSMAHAMRLPDAPRHAKLLDRWQAALTKELDAAWDAAESAWRKASGSAETVEYARRNAERLPELLNGTCDPVSLMFPEGRMDVADGLYRENIMGRYQHRAVRAFVGALGRPLRVLEVGAGTGATTERVLPELEGSDYLFTDVSKFFLDQARERFPGLRYALYDINSDGQLDEEFDVVIGGGVLNAAVDTDASVRRLRDLLCPGGWLVLSEPTVEEHWVLISQAFLLAEPADARAATGTTFLTHDQWRDVLRDAGLDLALDLPAEHHPLARFGHRVFLARKPLY